MRKSSGINTSIAPTGLLAVVILALCTVSTVFAQTSLNAKLAVRPLTTGDIAAYQLPSTTQKSGGLFTVGLGQPLYLEVQVNRAIPAEDITGVAWELSYKPVASAANLTDSPLGANVPVFEPSDARVLQVAGRKLLRPDMAGQYVITATVSTASNGSAKVAQTFVGAKYVGVSACTTCHGGVLPQNMVAAWSKTAHSEIFKDGIDGVASDHYAESCISCHTVGYDVDPGAVNGGFDDVAKQLNWAFPAAKAGNWDAAPDSLKNVANIQCENCHGPGSVHANSGGTPMGITVSYGSGACSQCHDAPTHHIKSAEWKNSIHAVAVDESGAGREGCVGCHTGPGFIDRTKGNTKTPNTTYGAINCQTCHESHGATTPDTNAHLVRTEMVTLADGTQVTDGGTGMLCMNCHQSRQNATTYAETNAANSRFGPHHGTQGDMLEGANAYTYGQYIPSSAHAFVVENTCVGCHMQPVGEKDPGFTLAGGHTFKPSFTSADSTVKTDLVAACQKCHGKTINSFDFKLMDYDGDGSIDGAQTEVQHLMDKLSTLLPPYGSVKADFKIDSTWTRAELKAVYNFQFVHDDGSRGIHNMAYTIGLLKASIADLSKK